MLTRGTINTVKAIEALNKQLDSVCRQRDELINDLKYTIIKNDPDCGLNYLEVTSYSIVNEPQGNRQDNGSYISEKCDDSLYCPDSGSGALFYPLENEEKYLRIDYIW